jgi:hypothetical protein
MRRPAQGTSHPTLPSLSFRVQAIEEILHLGEEAFMPSRRSSEGPSQVYSAGEQFDGTQLAPIPIIADVFVAARPHQRTRSVRSPHRDPASGIGRRANVRVPLSAVVRPALTASNYPVIVQIGCWWTLGGVD